MKWFLPVLFISYMAGITLFTHSHVVNGVTMAQSETLGDCVKILIFAS